MEEVPLYMPMRVCADIRICVEGKDLVPSSRALSVWRKGSAQALDAHIDLVCKQGFTEEDRRPQHVRAYISS